MVGYYNEAMDINDIFGEEEDGSVLNSLESRILELFERIEENQFEITLLKQGILSRDTIREEPSELIIQEAQKGLLEAKAAYTLRSNVISNVLVATPILKAVHAGSNASIIEQDLLPLLKTRDKASLALCELDNTFKSARQDLFRAEAEHIKLARRNQELSATMLGLAEQVSTESKNVADPKTRQRLAELEESLKASRQRWRIIKGTASATIVGSGVEWARVPKLLAIVLDDDDDEGE